MLVVYNFNKVYVFHSSFQHNYNGTNIYFSGFLEALKQLNISYKLSTPMPHFFASMLYRYRLQHRFQELEISCVSSGLPSAFTNAGVSLGEISLLESTGYIHALKHNNTGVNPVSAM